MKRNRLAKVILLTAILLALLCASASAGVVSAGRDFYYLDKANVLSEELEGEIFFSNRLLYSACGAQLVVVTVDSTGSEDIGDYAYELFNRWGIGSKAQDNGFLLLLAIRDDDYYALCGTGLQTRFTAGTLKSYFDQYLEADFAAGNYEAGVRRFFEEAFARIADTYNANVTVQQGISAYEQYVAANGTGGGFGGASGQARPDHGGGSSEMLYLLVILLIAIMLYRMIAYAPHMHAPGIFWGIGSHYRPGSGHFHTGSSGFSSWSGHSGGGFSSGRSSGFGGGFGGGGRSSGGGAGRSRH